MKISAGVCTAQHSACIHTPILFSPFFVIFLSMCVQQKIKCSYFILNTFQGVPYIVAFTWMRSCMTKWDITEHAASCIQHFKRNAFQFILLWENRSRSHDKNASSWSSLYLVTSTKSRFTHKSWGFLSLLKKIKEMDENWSEKSRQGTTSLNGSLNFN